MASTFVLASLVVCGVNADEPVAPPTCAMHLAVEVTPDVPNPGDGGFISSLLGDHAGYRLFLLQVVDDTHINLQLEGPGPNERCQAVVDSMRNDGRVLSIQEGKTRAVGGTRSELDVRSGFGAAADGVIV